MNNILTQIQANIEIIATIIASLSGLAVLIIVKYKEIKEALDSIKNASVNKAKVAAIAETTPLIARAMTDPLGIANELVNKDALPTSDPIPQYLKSKPDEAKKNIVAQALIEKEPKLLKKLKLKDILHVGNFVSDVYQMVKPIIKGK